LGKDPTSVGYSQHEGAEAADWDDEKLELVDGQRPVVYPAAGSHANFFDSALFVGSSGAQGVGSELRVPVDHLRGPLGRAPGRLLQRAYGSEPQDAMDRAGHLVRELAA